MESALAQRVTRYLNRQIAWFRQDLREAEAINTADTTQLTAWGESLPTRLGELETLEQEHHALLREWLASQAPDADRQAVRHLAAEAEELRRALETRYEALTQAVSDSLADTNTTLANLKRGQSVIQGYRPSLAEPGYIDRKA